MTKKSTADNKQHGDLDSNNDNSVDFILKNTHLNSYLELKDKVNLSSTSNNLHGFFDSELNKAGAQELLKKIIDRKFDEVKKMLESNPKFLIFRETVENHSGQTITATPFQAALGGEDENMLQLIEPFFDLLPGGATLKQQQFLQQFPNGIITTSYDFSELGRIFSSKIQPEQFIKEFKQHFKPGNIENGRHFDMQNIINAYKVLNSKQESWSWAVRSLFWINIIGFLKRLTPISYANLYYQDSRKPDPDPRLCLLSDNPIYPLEENKGLGFDWGISLESQGGRSTYEVISYRSWAPIEKMYNKNTDLLLAAEERLFPKELNDEHKKRCIIS